MSERAAADVTIVGAGIVGAACADSLTLEGLRVNVIESRDVGAGASAAGMGHLVTMDDSPAQFALTKYSIELWKRVAPQMPDAVELNRCGTIWLAANEREMTEAKRKAAFFAENGVAAEILDERQLREAEPNLRSGLTGALHVTGDCVIYPPPATQWLMQRAIERGARLIRAEAVEIDESAVVLKDGTCVPSKWIVNAAGVGAGALSRGIDVRPRKGLLVITDAYPGFVRHQLVELGYLHSAHGTAEDTVAFNVQPRRDGRVLIGSSRQFGNESPTVDDDVLARMMAQAESYMPGIAKLSIRRAWAGFRPTTPDRLPLIGPMWDAPNVLIAAGHEGLGITTALGTGELIADQILGRTSAIDVRPFSPARVLRR